MTVLAHAAPAEAPTLERLLGTWDLLAAPGPALAAAALGYLLAARRAGWPRARTLAFLGGLAVTWVALASGLGAYAEGLLSLHMVQHVVLTLVAAPLLVAGAPLTLALRVARPPVRRRLAAGAARAGRTVGRPAVAWALFVGVMAATHLTPFYGAALESGVLHEVEHALYLSTAVLFWTPLLSSPPVPRLGPVAALAYLGLAMPPMGALGAWLMSASEVVYEPYLAPARAWGVDALGDQRAAAGLMWTAGGLLLVAATVAVTWRAIVAEHERTVRRERWEAAR